MQTVIISIRGTKYHEGEIAWRTGRLRPGATIRLVAELGNPFDANAVIVVLDQTNERLGHVARELAVKYRALVLADKITRSVVKTVDRTRVERRLRILVAITFDPRKAVNAERKASRSASLYSVLPSAPGVYRMTNIRRSFHYIGSSRNIQHRIQTHFDDLLNGMHHNSPMQNDFNIQNGIGFTATVECITSPGPEDLSTAESRQIQIALAKGMNLYNLTHDGQGRAAAVGVDGIAQPITISERKHDSMNPSVPKVPVIGRSPTHRAERNEVDGTDFVDVLIRNWYLVLIAFVLLIQVLRK